MLAEMLTSSEIILLIPLVHKCIINDLQFFSATTYLKLSVISLPSAQRTLHVFTVHIPFVLGFIWRQIVLRIHSLLNDVFEKILLGLLLLRLELDLSTGDPHSQLLFNLPWG